MNRRILFSRWIAYPLSLALTVAICSLSSISATNAEVDAATETEVELSVEDLVKQAKPSVVVITNAGRDGNEQRLGTGFVISSDGLIATNLHVIGESLAIGVQTVDGKKLEVTEVFASDRLLDLAIIRVKAEGLQPLALGDSTATTQGEPLVVLGNPRGLRHSVVTGVLSGTREIEGRPMLQLAMPIEPGNSGGPVLDRKGRVLGVVTMKSAITENLGFAATSNSLQQLRDKPNTVGMDRWLKIGALNPKLWSTPLGGRWQSRGGNLTAGGTGAGIGGRSLCLLQEKPGEVPYEVGAWVKLHDESGAAGLIFCCNDEQHHYGFYPSAGKLRLSRFDGNDVFHWNVLQEKENQHYRPGEWNYFKVRLDGQKIRCFVNGEAAMESDDKTYTTGSVGLGKFRDTVADLRGFQVGPAVGDQPLTADESRALHASIEALPTVAELTPESLSAALTEHAAHSARLLRRKAKDLHERANDLNRIATIVESQQTLSKLSALIGGKPEHVDLVRACLLIAQLDGEEIDIDSYVQTIDRMFQEIEATLPSDASDDVKIESLNKYLFQQNGFHGSRTDYYHRANSYFNRVIDDREGLPITLSILYMELTKRLGIKADGIGLPGHFVVQLTHADGTTTLRDPFDEGKTLTRQLAAEKVQQFAGRALTDADLAPADNKAILLRVLSNLLGVAQQRTDREAMLRYLDAMLTIDSELTRERGMRALMERETGRTAAALHDLDWFLEHRPEGVDLDKIREMREIFQKR